MSLRKVIKNKRVFPTDEAAFKQLYLAIQNISKKWTMPIRNWGPVLNHFMIMFPEAFNQKVNCFVIVGATGGRPNVARFQSVAKLSRATAGRPYIPVYMEVIDVTANKHG